MMERDAMNAMLMTKGEDADRRMNDEMTTCREAVVVLRGRGFVAQASVKAEEFEVQACRRVAEAVALSERGAVHVATQRATASAELLERSEASASVEINALRREVLEEVGANNRYKRRYEEADEASKDRHTAEARSVLPCSVAPHDGDGDGLLCVPVLLARIGDLEGAVSRVLGIVQAIDARAASDNLAMNELAKICINTNNSVSDLGARVLGIEAKMNVLSEASIGRSRSSSRTPRGVHFREDAPAAAAAAAAPAAAAAVVAAASAPNAGGCYRARFPAGGGASLGGGGADDGDGNNYNNNSTQTRTTSTLTAKAQADVSRSHLATDGMSSILSVLADAGRADLSESLLGRTGGEGLMAGVGGGSGDGDKPPLGPFGDEGHARGGIRSAKTRGVRNSSGVRVDGGRTARRPRR